jgi:HlyD family secretion protein
VQVNRHRAQAGRLRRIVPAAGGVLLVALTVVSCTSDDSAQAPRTAKVERGTVTTGVSEAGSLTAITQQNLGFPNGGQLSAVNVKVGDHVEAGQVLAAVDDFALRQTLAQQQGQLTSQQAVLDRLTNSPVVAGSEDSLAQAKDILDATRNQTDAVLDADETAIDSAERQLDVDKKARDQAEDRLDRDEKACGGGSSSGRSEDDDDDDDDSSSSTPSSSPSSPSGSSASLLGTTDPACSAISSDEAAVTAAKQKVVASQAALDAAVQKRDVDKANGDLSIQNAQQSVVTAQNTANSASSDRPFDIAQQQGVVANAQAAVTQAQRDVDNATLKAPVAGTVSVINGVVGEYLAPSSGTSALAPGSGAAIPGVDSAAGAAVAAPGTAAGPTRPGGAQFLVLDDIDEFQVVAPFNESDAATIVPNQQVNVTVDAVPDLTLTGTVLSVAPTGTSISGVISYYVTVVVTGADPRLKDGQTVHATVVTNETDDVLTVPSAAVRQENGRDTVTVVDAAGGQTPVQFEPGAVGEDRTQVVSGLQEGQQVLLPATR